MAELVNKHMEELISMNDEYENKLLEVTTRFKNEFLSQIGQTYQEFNEKIESTQLIYNSENKLIKFKFTNNIEKKSFINENDNFEILKYKIKFINETLYYNAKINLGSFNKTHLNLFLYVSDEILKNNFKRLFRVFEKNIHKNINKSKLLLKSENLNDSAFDDFTINDIYKSDENFGEFVVTLINFFAYDKEEDKIIHIIQV